MYTAALPDSEFIIWQRDLGSLLQVAIVLFNTVQILGHTRYIAHLMSPPMYSNNVRQGKITLVFFFNFFQYILTFFSIFYGGRIPTEVFVPCRRKKKNLQESFLSEIFYRGSTVLPEKL